MEERQSRLLLTFVLSFGLWFIISYYLNPPQPPKKNPVEVAKDVTKTVKDTPAKDVKTLPVTPLKEIKIVDSKDIKKFTIVTSSFLVELSSLGGRIEKFYVKNYNDLDGKEVKIIKTENEFVTFKGEKYKAIEISREKGFDFNFVNNKEEVASSLYNHINFNSEFDEKNNTLSFEVISLDKKYIIKKVYTFFPTENYFKFNLTFKNTTNDKLILASTSEPLYFRSYSSLGPVKGEITGNAVSQYFRFYYLDGSFNDNIDGVSIEGFWSKVKTWLGMSTEKKDPNFDIVYKKTEPLDFFGSGSRYFIAALNSLDANKASGILLDNRKNNATGVVAVYDSIVLQPNESKSFDFGSYVGIRELDGMSFRDKNLDPKITQSSPFMGLSEKLDKSFNQGITTPFRHGIVWVLKKLYLVIPNYGWCIIIFGILLKLIFYPLNQKQAESMKKMQELSPQIKHINEKFANDPAKRQEKIMELYKKNNANPMGGCLPMLIQIPIFIALYTAFSDTIDLWKSPFLWINDLSEPDTIYTTPAFLGMTGIALNILPLIMVGSQFIQTKMTSVASDPNQQTMMYVLPFVMLYFFWTMPSGVVLYWTVQNLLSIAQQAYTNKFGEKK